MSSSLTSAESLIHFFFSQKNNICIIIGPSYKKFVEYEPCALFEYENIIILLNILFYFLITLIGIFI